MAFALSIGNSFVTAVARLSRRRDMKQAGQVVIAQVASQVVLIGTTPLLSRLYSPAAFGEFSALLSLATVSAAVLGLCYFVAIYFPKGERLLTGIYQLTIYLTFITGTVFGIGLWVLSEFDRRSIFSNSIVLNSVLLAVSATLLAYQNAANALQGRFDDYRSIAISKFNITLFPSLFQLAFAFTPLRLFGLQMGRIAGQFVTLLWSEYDLPRRYNFFGLMRPDWKAIRLAVVHYADSMIHVPRVLLVRGATALPPVFLLTLYGAIPAGLFFFADRLIGRPGQLLSEALIRIPQKNFAERIRRKRPILRLALGYTMIMLGLGTPAVLLIAFFGRWLFGTFFGPQWVDAASFAAVTAVPTAVRLAFTPMSGMIPTLRLQRWSTFVDVFFFFRVFLMFAAHALGYGPLVAIGVVSAMNVLYDTSNFAIGFRAARRYDLSLKA